MKKLILIITILFTSNILAEDTTFFGIDINRIDNSIYDNNIKNHKFDTIINVKVGYMSDIRRHYISYTRPIDTNTIKYENILYNYDYFLDKYDSVTPYIGGHAGLGILQYNVQQQNTFDYGLQIGLLHDLTYSSHIDFGLKYSNSNNVYIGNIKYKANKAFYLGVTIGFEDLLY